MRFRKRPVVIDATQWFKNGDHPEDGTERFTEGEFVGERYEGKIVRYFRHPRIPGDERCHYCGLTMHVHGWIDTREGGHIVCPGDWIITGVQGEHYPCKPDIFAETYTAILEAPPSPSPTCARCGEPFSFERMGVQALSGEHYHYPTCLQEPKS